LHIIIDAIYVSGDKKVNTEAPPPEMKLSVSTTPVTVGDMADDTEILESSSLSDWSPSPPPYSPITPASEPKESHVLLQVHTCIPCCNFTLCHFIG